MKKFTKMNRFYLAMITILLVTIATDAFVQTTTNVERLTQLAIESSQEWDRNQEKVKEYCSRNNLPIRRELGNGNVILMVNVEKGKPQYLITHNIGAAQTTRTDEVWPGGSTGFNITGSGYDKLGVWDVGSVRDTHVEFTDQGESRITQMDEGSPLDKHSTHVAGTLIAAGVDADAKGMAFEAQLQAWDWLNGMEEFIIAAADGLEISNHSYGGNNGWTWIGSEYIWSGNPGIDSLEDFKFGYYSQNAELLDEIMYNAPNHLFITSAGNHRGEGPGNAGQDGIPEKDGGEDGYDCIAYTKPAKNIMTVGAVHQVSEYTGPDDVVMTSFSSWGPTDDGRVKPDIVGKGEDVYSSSFESDNSYYSNSGTSMASPNVAGSAALLQYYYQSLFNNPMRSATLKGLIIHSADEAGPHDGPDYRFGWGLMNTARAAHIINEDTVHNVMSEHLLSDGNTFSRNVATPGDTVLRVTICWTDLAGTPVDPPLNNREPLLVNDLDLKIVANDITYYPYRLDPDNPSAAPSVDGKNNVDNVEMVYVANAPAGAYNIYIDHEGTLENDGQAFSLIISGITDMPLPACSESLLIPENGEEDILLNQQITWENSPYANSYNIYFGTDGGGTETPTNIFNGKIYEDNSFFYLFDHATTYYLQVLPENEAGTAEGCNEIWSFTTMEAITVFPFEDDFTEVNPPDLPFGYQSYDYSESTWRSVNQVGHNDNYSMICMHPQGEVTEFDNWLFSLPFMLTGEKEYTISFYYKNPIPGNAENIEFYHTTNPNPDETDNMIFQDIDFDQNGWKQTTVIYEPEVDEVSFFAFRANSNNGYGIFIDDFMINGWSVGIEQSPIIDRDEINPFIKPNPFSTSTTIEYELHQPETVRITFYNHFGKQVDVIEETQEKGLNRIEWTAENLADGIYYFRLEVGEEVGSGKVVLVR